MKKTLLLCLHVMLNANCFGYKIVTCNNNGLDIEARGTKRLKCTGITDDDIYWEIFHPGNTRSIKLSECWWSTKNCTDPNSDYTVTRLQYDTSVLTVTANHRQWLNGTVRCGGYEPSLSYVVCKVRVHAPTSGTTRTSGTTNSATQSTTITNHGKETDNADSNEIPTAAIAGGAGSVLLLIVIIVVIVIVAKKRRGSPGTNGNKDTKEMDGDEPAESTQSQPLDEEQYAVVQEPTTQKKPTGSHNDNNAETDKTRSKQKGTDARGIQENASDAASGDVYAQVNKNPKRDQSASAGTPQPGTETYAQVQKNQPTAKPPDKPAGQLEPAKEGKTCQNYSVQSANARRQFTTASGYEDVELLNEMTPLAENDDEYNRLNFRRNAPIEPSCDPGAQYSHIGAIGQ